MKYEFSVQSFSYNGFCGTMGKSLADYKANFKEWVSDPGIAMCSCSDGVERMIPTYALIGDFKGLPEQPKSGMMFGAPCDS